MACIYIKAIIWGFINLLILFTIYVKRLKVTIILETIIMFRAKSKKMIFILL